MKALSVRQPWASMIAGGVKTIEVRSWPTTYRGELLIVASRKPKMLGLPVGQAIAIVQLVDCRQMRRADERAAIFERYAGAYAWVLECARRISPFAVRGRLKLYDVSQCLDSGRLLEFFLPIGHLGLQPIQDRAVHLADA